MITGCIAAFLLIVILPPAIGNGETGVIMLTVIIALGILFFGIISRADDRATTNRMWYWADGYEPDWKCKKSEQNGHVFVRTVPAREVYCSSEHVRDGYACPGCGGLMKFTKARRFSDGTMFSEYECSDCGEKKLVNNGKIAT